jgi:Protein of unknown function (DUF1552)
MTSSRRTFLRSTGIGLALPLLDAFLPRSARAAESQVPQRMVTICTTLGLHKPFLHPEQKGRDYELTPYLKIIADHREQFTLFDGISHPSQTGSDGHSSVATWLTAAPNPGLAGFRNTISIDQLLAERIGLETRYSSLQLSTDGSSQSHTSSGIMLPGEQSPAKLFAKLFLDGTAEERKMQLQRLQEGRSILDMLQSEAKAFARRVGTRDKQKLKEYYESIREMERRITAAEAWIHKPKPKVDAKKPEDVSDEKDLIGRIELIFELIPLAIQTDSTRLITVMIQGRNDVPMVPGVSIDHHNLSHHGQDPEKIRQLALVEEAQFRALNKLFVAMKDKTEGGSDLLQNTSILFGSNLGNANAHDTKNLPIMLAGGRFRHGQHLVLDRENNVPMCNLLVQIAQQMGQEIDQFGSSNSSSITGLESVA